MSFWETPLKSSWLITNPLSIYCPLSLLLTRDLNVICLISFKTHQPNSPSGEIFPAPLSKRNCDNTKQNFPPKTTSFMFYKCSTPILKKWNSSDIKFLSAEKYLLQPYITLGDAAYKKSN